MFVVRHVFPPSVCLLFYDEPAHSVGNLIMKLIFTIQEYGDIITNVLKIILKTS